jgi:hypothetical protein
MTEGTEAVTSLKRRITTVLFLRQALLWLGGWCVLWGVGGLVARFAFGVAPAKLAWGAIAIPVVITAALVRTRKPADRQLVALVDAHARAGGLVMAAHEVDLGEWRASAASTPRVQWNARRETAIAILSAAFAVAVVLVPARKTEARQPLAIGRDIQRLEERVEMLREEEIIADAQAEVLAKTLEELKREATGEDAAKAWEALDTIEEATAQAAKEAGEKAVEEGQQLTQLEAMAFALGSDAVDPSKLDEGMRDLASELAGAQQESKALSNVDPKDLKAVEAAARAGKEQLREMLNKLKESGLIDPKTLRQFEKATEFANRDGLGKFLKEHGSGTKLSTAVGQWQKGSPSVNRGRGDAPMYFGESSREDGQFNEQTIPAAAAAALERSQLVAVSAASPAQENTQRSAGGALNDAKAGPGSAHTAEVLPRHRGTVQRFFERKK